jgi:hypothetical protein
LRPQEHHTCPALLPCGCYGLCDCPPYALAATGFWAVVAMVLMAPAFISLPERRLDSVEMYRMARIGLGVFLVLLAFQFALTVLAMLAAAFAERHRLAARIWGLAKVIVGMALGSAGGVAAMLLLWGLLQLP